GARRRGGREGVLEDGPHRQRDCRRLAGAGLRDTEHIAAGEHVGYGLLLDRGGGRVAGRLYSGENFVGQAELRKGHETSNHETVRSLTAPDDGTTTNVARGRTVEHFSGRTVGAKHSHSRLEVNPAAVH